MMWINNKVHRVHPALNSLASTASQPLSNNYEEPTNRWKIIGSGISLVAFVLLLSFTAVGIPIIVNDAKKSKTCTTDSTENTPTNSVLRLCAANATWSAVGVTVAGFTDGSSSTSLAGLRYPRDVYVQRDGSLLIADYGNDRVTKWNPNSTTGVLVAGTGASGSWMTLLARPTALTVRAGRLHVSDAENYRIQMFPRHTTMSSPEAVTLIGRYGQGSGLDQLNYVTSLVAPVSAPTLLYMSDTNNHRVLVWDAMTRTASLVAGKSGSFGSDPERLHTPSGIAVDERAKTLYVADRDNSRIQKYTIGDERSGTTVAGWGQLNGSSAVQLDPTGRHMFIADTFNHRVVLWLDGASRGRTIAGNGQPGLTAVQLDHPTQLRFDANHNLYVVDTSNSRIQRFDLLSNGC